MRPLLLLLFTLGCAYVPHGSPGADVTVTLEVDNRGDEYVAVAGGCAGVRGEVLGGVPAGMSAVFLFSVPAACRGTGVAVGFESGRKRLFGPYPLEHHTLRLTIPARSRPEVRVG